MGVLDGFLATWSKARDTFGEGTPPTGERFDQSGQFKSMQSTVETAAPGSRWSGTAASAYDKANTDHGKVFGNMASLDQRLGERVTHSANIVTTGRQNLDAVRQWVVDAAANVPAGKNREQLLLPIVSQGLSQVQDIVKDSNGQMNGVAKDIQTLKGEYQALGAGVKFKEGPADVQGVQGDDKDKKDLKPEDMQDVVKKALEGDSTAAGQVKGIFNSITPDQMGPNSKANPLTPLQAETVGQMQAQMKPMSMDELNAAHDRLGDNKGILGDAMQVASDPDVTYPRHDKGGAQVVPTTGGYPLPNDGVLPGDRGALPDSVQHTLNEADRLSGPPSVPSGPPSAYPDQHLTPREQAAQNLHDLANIVDDGDQKFQQGSELDRGMMHGAKEFLNSSDPAAGHQSHAQDGVIQRVFETAGRDTIVSHDMFTSDKDFTHDVLTHEWKDNGKAASTLTNWIEGSAHSPDPVVNMRAGETASALASYLGDPENKDALMNINTGTQENVSMGKLNPDLAQSLAHAMDPYVDEMAGRNLDNTSGWHPIDGKADLSYPHATNVFAALGTDENAAKILDMRSAQVQSAYINDYAHSVTEPNGPVDSSAMEAAGRLKGITDQGGYLAAFDEKNDAAAAQKLAHERMSNAYDTVKDMVGLTPYAGPALTLQADLMKMSILGPDPEGPALGHAAIQSSDTMRTALASTFIQHGVGDPGALTEFYHDGQLIAPPEDASNPRYIAYTNAMNAYLYGIGNSPLDGYDKAYRDVIQ